MILASPAPTEGQESKPRASGDDPYGEVKFEYD